MSDHHLILNVFRNAPKPKPITLMFRDADARMVRTTRDAEAPNNGNASAKPDGNPSSTTTGGAAGPGMKQTLVVAFPLEQRFAYWPQMTPGGTEVWRRDLQSGSDPEKVGGPFALGSDAYHWFDQTTEQWRLWQTSRPPVLLNEEGSRRGAATDGVLSTNSHLWDRHGPDASSGSEAEPGGVGAVSWVGKRSNSTGYRINTGDARPGIALGRGAAQLVARRVGALEQINSMNRKAWSV